MAKAEVYLPAMGEGVIEATITRWLVKEGDRVEEDQPVVEVATDKVDSEIPSPHAGVIAELLFGEGDAPQVGQAILTMETEGEMAGPSADEVKQEVDRIKSGAEEQEGEPEAAVGTPAKEQEPATPKMESHSAGGRFLSPLVRSIAEKEGISPDELETLKGSGKDNRLTRDDVLRYLEQKKEGAVPPAAEKKEPAKAPEAAAPVKPATAPTVVASAQDEVIEMDRMRRLIAEHMVYSKHTSPHVTSFIEVDMTTVVSWRNRLKEIFLKQEKQKITFMPIFIEAAARALRDFPMINVSVDGTRIIKKKKIHIGMATALPNGNLIVPVIREADEKNLIGLAKSVNDLAHRARNNQLKPDEITGGTFTITNFGTFDSLTGTPVINQPEVAILGVGAIVKKPAVIETPQGDTIGIRHIMVLSLSYDHRVVDGALGGMYLKKVKEYLEGFDPDRKI